VSGAEERARAAGFHLEVFKWPRDEMSDDRMDQILKARGIRGLVIAPMTSPGGEIRLDWDHYAAAAVGATMHFPRLHRVRHDAFHSIQTALEQLRAAGCRRIGLALSLESAARVTYFWEAGFVHAPDVREMPARAQLIYRPERFERDGLVRWVRRMRLDGLLIPDHRCYTWLCEAGLAIPGEIAVAALNRYGQPAELAGVDQQLGAMGAATVDLVIEQYQRGEFGIPAQPKDVLMGGVWIAGRTALPPHGTMARARTSRKSSAPRSVRRGAYK
jgi:LacI family transcriptional regulator